MKNKNKKLQCISALSGGGGSRLNSACFREKWLIYMSPPKLPGNSEVVNKDAEISDDAQKFLNALREHSLDGVAPKEVHYNNPYWENFNKFADEKWEDVGDVAAVKDMQNLGKLVITNVVGDTFDLDGSAYIAVFWKRTKANLDKIDKIAGINDHLLNYAILYPRHAENVAKLVFAAARGSLDKKRDKVLIEKALKEIETLKPNFKPELYKERIKLGGTIERAGFMRDIAEKDVDGALGITDEGVEAASKAIPWLELEALRDMHQIDATNWRPWSASGLEAVKKDWGPEGLGLPITTEFYEGIFAQLAKSTDKKFLEGDASATPPTPGKSKEIQKMYRDPENHLTQLKNHDIAFHRAFKFFQSIQHFVVQQGEFQKKIPGAIDALDNDKYAQKLINGVQSNVKKLQRALKEKDYATVAVYAAGIYALYKTAQGILNMKNEKGEDMPFKKFLLWGAAAYAGNEMLKVAGIDVLKKLGFKSMESEVLGTPLEAIARLGIPEATKMDFGVYMRLSEMPLTQLHQLYTNTPIKDGRGGTRGVALGWIDPKQMPNHFPMFNDREYNRDNDPEYKRVGEQIYLAMHVLIKGYEKTLMSDKNSAYFGKSFEQVIDPSFGRGKDKEKVSSVAISNMNVRHLTGVLLRYAPMKFDNLITTPEAVKNARTRFQEVFKGKDMGANIGLETIGQGENQRMTGEIMGMPVVILPYPSLKKYFIVSRSKYEEKNGELSFNVDLEREALGVVPFEGAFEGDVDAMRDNITSEVDRLLGPIRARDGDGYARPEWKKGRWSCTVGIDGVDRYGIAGFKEEATITFLKNGVISVKSPSMSSSLDIDANPDRFRGNVILAHLAAQPDMQILSPLHRARKIHFLKEHATKPEFHIKVEGAKDEVKVTYEGGKFKIGPEGQKLILKNQNVRMELKNSLENSEEMNRATSRLIKLVNDADEDFKYHFFKSGAGWFTGATVDKWLAGVSDDLAEGAVDEEGVTRLVKSQEEFLRWSVYNRVAEAKSFVEASKVYEQYWLAGIDKFEARADYVSAENHKHVHAKTNWDRTNFDFQVARPIANLGVFSDTMKDARITLDRGIVQKFGPDRIYEARSLHSEHASHLDGKDLDGVFNPPAEGKKMDINDPSSPTNDWIMPTWKMAYIAYLDTAIPEHMSIKTRILHFEEWVRSDKFNIVPLHKSDLLQPYDNEDPIHKVKVKGLGEEQELMLTDLQNYFWERLRALQSEVHGYGDILDGAHIENIDAFIYEYAFVSKGGAKKSDMMLGCEELSAIYNKRRLQELSIERRVDVLRSLIVHDKDMWLDKDFYQAALEKWNKTFNSD